MSKYISLFPLAIPVNYTGDLKKIAANSGNFEATAYIKLDSSQENTLKTLVHFCLSFSAHTDCFLQHYLFL